MHSNASMFQGAGFLVPIDMDRSCSQIGKMRSNGPTATAPVLPRYSAISCAHKTKLRGLIGTLVKPEHAVRTPQVGSFATLILSNVHKGIADEEHAIHSRVSRISVRACQHPPNLLLGGVGKEASSWDRGIADHAATSPVSVSWTSCTALATIWSHRCRVPPGSTRKILTIDVTPSPMCRGEGGARGR